MQVMDFLLPLGAVAIIVGIFWYAFQYAQAAFIVRVRAGSAKVVKGKLTAAFIQELEDVCRQNQIKYVTLRGVRRGRRVALVFSPSIPMSCQQQLRNVWAMQ